MKNIFSLLLLFITFDVVAQTYTVGTQTITYTDAARSNRSVGVEFRYPGTNSAVATGQFPFVIFAHGFAMDQVPYYPYADTLAKQGFIVGLLTTETSLLPAPSHPDFAQDLIFVYNKLIAESSSNSSSPFYQKVIPKGAIGGHSMGGGSTVLSAQYSNPATCYFTFAAANTNPSSITAAPSMTKPYLSFAGSRDCIAPIATHQQPMYDASGSACKFLINITDALHCQFGSGNAQCNLGEGLSFCASSPLSRAAQINKTLYYLIPYLDYYLKGDCSAWTLFESRYSSNTVDALQRNCTNIVPSNATINGNNYFCTGSSATLSASPAGFNYLWNDNSTADTLNVSAAGNYSVVVGNGVCSLPSVSVSMIENFLPTIGTIEGADTICESTASTVYYLSSVTNADTIVWWATNPLAIISGQGTDTVIVFNNGFAGTIWAYSSNVCGQSPIASATVFLADTPQVIITLQGNQLVSSYVGVSYQWYLDGVLLQNEIDSSIMPQQTGNYTVLVTDNRGCSSISQPFNFILTNVGEAKDDGLRIFPNPVQSGKLQFQFTENWQAADVTIFDLQGREVTKRAIKPEIDISNLQCGSYLMNVETNGRKLIQKLILE